jgi:GAF domain-containing protein
MSLARRRAESATVLRLRKRVRRMRADLEQRTRQYDQLLEVGLALATETDRDRLQNLILRTAREMTDADAGSLYLIQETAGGEKELVFLYAQNDSVDAGYRRQSMPLTTNSIAGYVALTGQIVRLADAYNIPAGVPYRHNRAFDERFGYRTGSMLTLPLFSHGGEVIGVLQVMNRKRRFEARLTSPAVCEREVLPFGEGEEHLLRAFAGHAAAALENKLLVESVENLFEGFIRATTTAV